jgi:hypothetical protein
VSSVQSTVDAYADATFEGAAFATDAYGSATYTATLVYPSPFITTKGDLQILL